MEEEFNWKTTRETRWSYGNIASPTKIFTLSRLGGPITMLNWQLKRNNLRLASYSSDAEGSLRLYCEHCSKFQIMSPRADKQIGLQGCSMCINKSVFIDTTALVSNIFRIESYYNYNILNYLYLGTLRCIWDSGQPNDLYYWSSPSIPIQSANLGEHPLHRYTEHVPRQLQS